MPKEITLQEQLINNGALKPTSLSEGFLVEGSIAGAITVTLQRIDKNFMRCQYYFRRVFNIAKQLGTAALVVNLEGDSEHGNWTQLLREHGLTKSRSNQLSYHISRTEMEQVDIG